jgi:hypothetical protein
MNPGHTDLSLEFPVLTCLPACSPFLRRPQMLTRI